VWLCVKLFGAEKFRAAILEKRELALDAARRIARIPGIVIDAAPQLSLFAFHVTRPGATLEQENAATKQLIDDVTNRGRVMLTGCTVDERFLARVCVLSFRTRQLQIDQCVEDVADASRSLILDP
jgi:aromatic-L-amino-acid decarboxylase